MPLCLRASVVIPPSAVRLCAKRVPPSAQHPVTSVIPLPQYMHKREFLSLDNQSIFCR
jgi:hypothetical protein